MVKVAGPVEAAASLRRVLGHVDDYFGFSGGIGSTPYRNIIEEIIIAVNG